MKGDYMKSKLKKPKSMVSYIFLIILLVLVIAFFTRLKSYNQVQISKEDPVLGRNDAPVTLVMFGQYQCGVTFSFFEDIFPFLKSEYIDKGKMKFVYKNHYADLSPKTILPVKAALCANEQGRFWEYNAVLFERTDEWSQSIESQDAGDVFLVFSLIFEKYAKELGLNTTAFTECINANRHLDRLRNDHAFATNKLGVKKTPSFYINGLMIDGLPSLNDFKLLLS